MKKEVTAISLRRPLWAAAAVLAAAATALVLVVVLTEPTEENRVGWFIFFPAVFLLGSSVFFSLLSLVYTRCAKSPERALRAALRHGLCSGLALTVVLWLARENLLTWWSALFALGGASLPEFYYLLIIRSRNR